MLESRRHRRPHRRHHRLALLGVAALGGAAACSVATPVSGHRSAGSTVTPVRHLVVLFQENVSFDHYFGTYPHAANTDGQPFQAAPGTPAVDGLLPATDPSLPPGLRHATDLTATNPNTALPHRLDSSPTGLAGGAGGQLTCDQDHDYADEQSAFDGGRMDRFVQSVGTDGGTRSPSGTACLASTDMDYFDGNAVPAMWRYAQQYAMSDNLYGTTFGPSAPGAVNLVSGDTGQVDTTHEVNSPSVATPAAPDADLAADGTGGFSLTSDAQPYWDDCSTRDAVAMAGDNIGDRLGAADLSWGWFEGGFRPTTTFTRALAATGHAGQSTSTFVPDEFASAGFQSSVPHSSNQGLCDAVHPVGVALGGAGQYGYKDDYIPHHEPFEFYATTANPHHLSVATGADGQDTVSGLRRIGTDTQTYVHGVPQFDTPNHNYDVSDFDQLVASITRGTLPASALPAVSFLKAPGYQDGHAAYSEPADEQAFVTREIDALMHSPAWSSTAVLITYDDSDGWYDHAQSGVGNPSLSPSDNLTGTTTTGATSGQCGPRPQTRAPLANEQGRCGLGPRLPMLLISPFARHDRVDHDLGQTASIVELIEYNWRLRHIPGSADELLAGTDRAERIDFDLAGLFDFSGRATRPLLLDPATGRPSTP